MKKILFITSSLSYGGKERQTVEMIRILAIEYSITLVVLNKTKISFTNDISIPNFQYRILSPDSKNVLKRYCCYYKIVEDFKPDILHTMDAISSYFSVIIGWVFRIPVINGSIRHAGVTHGFQYLFESISLLLSDYIIANSIAGLKYYNLHNSRKASVIYNFIDTSRFILSKRALPTIIMTANFSPYKDHTTILSCCERLLKEKKIHSLHFIGDGPYLKKYKELILEKGLQNEVIFWGKINNVEEILSTCSIGVLCSTIKYKEGISNSILEYMGSGLVAIASDIGGTSEIIEHERNGLLFEVENPHSLYNCIDWVLTHPEESQYMIQEGFETLKSKFSAQGNCALLKTIYHKYL